MSNQTRRLPAEITKADRNALVAVNTMSDYTPFNQEFGADQLLRLEAAVAQAQQAEIRAQNVLAAARDATVAAEWALHNAVIGAKSQVIAQYGADSDQVQALGLKKKSERKHPARRKAA